MKDLMARAAQLGVHVQLAHLDDETLAGFYDKDTNTITLDLGLNLPQLLETFGHELGHCFYGDECSSDHAERRADRYAARLLIDPERYRAAELIDPDPGAIATELGQTRRMVRVYQRDVLPALSLSRKWRSASA